MPIRLPATNQSRVQLHIPIYVALRSYERANSDELSFEEGDEMKFIRESDSGQLYVYHLRSGLKGHVARNLLRLDESTPLRLAINERSITNRCLENFNQSGAYLIRCSQHTAMDYVLSIAQCHKECHADQWHYLICYDPATRCFHFRDENLLRDIQFPSFRRLVNDERVRRHIPLGEVLPYSIEFEEEVWKIPFSRLVIGNKIGEGAFGEVFRAEWRKDKTTRQVAVKKVRLHGMDGSVTREIEAMITLTNLNIVSLFGVSSNRTSNEIYLVTEYMENGDLKTWLKNLSELPDYRTIVRFARDIAYGMSYLEECNYVHRDLACRNILVGPNTHVLKIADFGLSTIVNDRDAEGRQEAHAQKLPFRWAAPEIFEDKTAYSIKSDVWSYGILLIEIWLKGGNPYGEEHIAYIQSFVRSGQVHEKPAECPQNFYQSIIFECLRFEARDRPRFGRLRQMIDQWQCD